jgi:hypothetical protein
VPDDVNGDAPLDVEVSFEAAAEEDQRILAELEAIRAEMEEMGPPEGDTREERERRAALFRRGLELLPPLTDAEIASLEESIQRPMSMFHLAHG